VLALLVLAAVACAPRAPGERGTLDAGRVVVSPPPAPAPAPPAPAPAPPAPAPADAAGGPAAARPGAPAPAMPGCAQDADCVAAAADCCGCAAGGAAVAVGRAHLAAWEAARQPRCAAIACIAMMSTDPSCALTPRCRGGSCALGR
jgi:hypothetical protein